MDSYLSTVIPDYATTTLSVTPQNTIKETPILRQNLLTYDSGAIEAVSVTDDIYFQVSLEWTSISIADAATIRDFFLASAKGHGMAQSFKWLHPTDGNTYVVKFLQAPSKSILHSMPGLSKIATIKLQVIGNA